jgi:hypothetical protein
MAHVDRSDEPDAQVQRILDALVEYEAAHPQALVEARRHNSVSIRLRVVDPDFEGLDRIQRESEVWRLLDQLPEEAVADITMVILLAPAEAENSPASADFDDPIPSLL